MTEAQSRRKEKRAAWLAGKQAMTAQKEGLRPRLVRDASGQRIHLGAITMHRDAMGSRETAEATYVRGYVIAGGPTTQGRHTEAVRV